MSCVWPTRKVAAPASLMPWRSAVLTCTSQDLPRVLVLDGESGAQIGEFKADFSATYGMCAVGDCLVVSTEASSKLQVRQSYSFLHCDSLTNTVCSDVLPSLSYCLRVWLWL